MISVSLLFSVPIKPNLADLINLSPDTIGAQKAKADDYFRQACFAIADTQWAEPIKVIKQWAEGDAETILRDTPQEKLPLGIHTLDLREYLISKALADRLYTHLWNQQRSETLAKFRNARELVTNRLAIRDRESRR
jgi:hypothetical protein